MERFGGGTEKTGLWQVTLPEEPSQRFLKRTGVVLRRNSWMEGDASVQLFLKGSGTTGVYIPGASRGSQRFGGALEPLVWGHFQLYQSKRRTYLKEIEVIEDFWGLRRIPQAVAQALKWAKMLDRYLIAGYPYDDLLALFYWAQKALLEGAVPDLVHSRFLWRWLLSWGIAPDLRMCSICGQPLEGGGVWQDGAFASARCAPGRALTDLGEFAEYALSNRFIPSKMTPGLLNQARLVAGLFMKNLDENR